jgi:monoterpene epsilon-lactone hydrolase
MNQKITGKIGSSVVPPDFCVYARRMTSFRTRAATRLVSTLGVKRRLQELADSYDDPAQFDRLLQKIRKYDRRDPPSRVSKRLDHEQIDVDGHNLHLFSNGGGGSRRVILYLHGGGYMFGPFAPEWKMASSIAASTNSNLAVFVYPRTPDDQAERTVDITLRAYQAVLDRFSGHEVVLVGTSAGGGLGIVLMVEAALRGMSAPSRAVLVSPAVDMVLQENLDAAEAGDVLLSADYVRLAGSLYAGALATDHPWISPTNGNLEGLPPLQVFAGSREILSPGIETFVGRARAEGSSVELVIGEDQQHTWPTMSTPEGHQARDAIAAFIVAEDT